MLTLVEGENKIGINEMETLIVSDGCIYHLDRRRHVRPGRDHHDGCGRRHGQPLPRGDGGRDHQILPRRAVRARVRLIAVNLEKPRTGIVN